MLDKYSSDLLIFRGITKWIDIRLDSPYISNLEKYNIARYGTDKHRDKLLMNINNLDIMTKRRIVIWGTDFHRVVLLEEIELRKPIPLNKSDRYLISMIYSYGNRHVINRIFDERRVQRQKESKDDSDVR